MALLETIGNLRAWQVAVIIAVWVLGIAGAFGVYQFTTRTDDNGGDTLGEDQQLYSVATGDLVNKVSVSGDLVFPNREALDFGVQGTVGRVLVVEGDFVTEGQTLAVLDEESIANLEKEIAQAELDLRDAREALDKALAPYTALDLARSESDVANSDADLKSKRDDLAAMLAPSEHAVAQAEAKVASAKVAVSAAEAALESVKEPPSNHERVSARSRITNARALVEEASEALRFLREGPDEKALEEARLKIDSAQVSLRIAKLDLFLLSDDWDGKLGEERDMLEAARDAYATVFIKWLGIELTEAERDTEPDALLESWNADLSTLFIREDSLHGVQVPPDDPATRWNDPHVYVWTHFYPGRVFATCESAAAVGGPCVKAEMDEAWAVIGPLEDSIRKLTIQEDKAVTSTQLAVTRAEENLDQAKEDLADLLADPDRIDVEVKQASLNLAISVLQEAEDDLVVLMAGTRPEQDRGPGDADRTGQGGPAAGRGGAGRPDGKPRRDRCEGGRKADRPGRGYSRRRTGDPCQGADGGRPIPRGPQRGRRNRVVCGPRIGQSRPGPDDDSRTLDGRHLEDRGRARTTDRLRLASVRDGRRIGRRGTGDG